MNGQAHRRKARIEWFIAGLVAAVCGVGPALADQPSLERVGRIELKGKAGPLDHLLVDSRHGRLFVANQSNNTLDIVDLKSNKLVKQIPDQKEIHGIAYVPDLDRIFVGNGKVRGGGDRLFERRGGTTEIAQCQGGEGWR